MTCMVAADTKLETPEGPLTIKSVGAAPTPVMTRTAEGAVRFAMSSAVRVVAAAQPVLRLTLANGRSLRVGAEQRLLGPGAAPRRAGDLAAGDALLDVFAFPAGYTYQTDAGEARVSDGCVAITAVAAAGAADCWALSVAHTGCFVFSAGVVGLDG